MNRRRSKRNKKRKVQRWAGCRKREPGFLDAGWGIPVHWMSKEEILARAESFRVGMQEMADLYAPGGIAQVKPYSLTYTDLRMALENHGGWHAKT